MFAVNLTSAALYLTFMTPLWFIVVATQSVLLPFLLFWRSESSLLPLLCRPLVVKCILVASPGFVKDQFINYLFKEAVRQDNKTLLENRPKFMLVHSSSGHKYSLKGTSCFALRIKQSDPTKKAQTQWNTDCFAEILSDPTVTSRLSDTKVTMWLVVSLFRS